MRMTRKEVAKVTHDINNVWHTKYKDVHIGIIYTHANRPDSPSYAYTFVNYGFDNYVFIEKKPTKDRGQTV